MHSENDLKSLSMCQVPDVPINVLILFNTPTLLFAEETTDGITGTTEYAAVTL